MQRGLRVYQLCEYCIPALFLPQIQQVRLAKIQERESTYSSIKICALTYARLQGLNQLIEHFENSKVLNQKEKKYRPIIKLDKIQKMVLEQQARWFVFFNFIADINN